jgi:tetratricopeptide (TPR) repeat protein
VLAITALLIGVRDYDLVSQRAYIAAGDVNLFGAGISTWYPERAADFVVNQKLPGNIFHDYNLGGFLALRLGPQYPVYIDGRAIPFGEIMADQRNLLRQSPDSPDWQREADSRGINTLIFSLARYWGLSTSSLGQFCGSQEWKPVYLDTVAIVMVRNRPENAGIIARHPVDCATVRFDPPAELVADKSIRGRAELFNYYAHAGSILYKLSRTAEAEAFLTQAIQMRPEEPYLHHTMGQLYEVSGRRTDAEREYELSAKLNPTEANWYTLAMLYSTERRYGDAAHALEQAALVSVRPSGYYSSLGGLYLSLHKPEDALRAYDAAAANADYEPPEMRASIEAAAAEGRIRAERALRGN